jgi:hypothetical protein
LGIYPQAILGTNPRKRKKAQFVTVQSIEAALPTNQFADVEGIALPIEACAK